MGTLAEVGGADGNVIPSGLVCVVWDSGTKCNYRAGHNGADDLRVLDNAQAGMW